MQRTATGEMTRPTGTGAPSAVGAIFFFVFYISLYYVSRWAQGATGLRWPWPIEVTALYWFLLTAAVARLYDPAVYTSKYWHGSTAFWKGVAAAIGLQCLLGVFKWPGTPYVPYEVAAITFGPVTEEIVRTVMLNAMEARWGSRWAVGVTSFLFALGHPFFWAALVQCSLLALISLKSRKSLPCAMAAHYAMNLIAVGAVPWVFHWLQLKLL